MQHLENHVHLMSQTPPMWVWSDMSWPIVPFALALLSHPNPGPDGEHKTVNIAHDRHFKSIADCINKMFENSNQQKL